MPNRTSNSIFLLNFDDPDNPLYDECGNTWTATNPQLIYDEELGRYVANFKDGITQHLVSNELNVNLTGNDYTIEIYYKIERKPSSWSCLYFIINNNIYYSSFIQYTNAIEFRNNSNSAQNTNELQTNLFYSWIHLVIVYEDLFSTANIYINGKKEYTYTSLKKVSYINSDIKIGNGFNRADYNFNGRMAFIHFTKGALYTSNFNYLKQVTYNKHVHTESNTKRMTAFTYSWNVQRETKWNQKANMYVINPDHHISQGKKE